MIYIYIYISLSLTVAYDKTFQGIRFNTSSGPFNQGENNGVFLKEPKNTYRKFFK